MPVGFLISSSTPGIPDLTYSGYSGVRADCAIAKAIELNPTYSKAYYRRGVSYLSILRPTDAVVDFKKALSIEPGNKAARDQLNMTVKLIRRIEFEKVCFVTFNRIESHPLSTLPTADPCYPSSWEPI